MWFRIAFSLTAAFTAMVMDLRTGCVDNGWLIFCMIISLVFNGMEKGAAGVGFFALGVVFPFILLWFLFLFHMLGAGDIKLFCVLGGLLGVPSIGVCVAVSFLIGAVLALAILISTGNFRQRFQYLYYYMKEYLLTGEKKAYIRKGMDRPENFHFTVPIFLSVLLYAGGVY